MAYGVPFDEINSLTEGQQADEYLRRKAARIEKDSKENEDKYGSDDLDGFSLGRRTQGYYAGTFDPDRDKSTPSTDRNPRFDTARELKQHRRQYGSPVIPSKKSQSEKDLEKAENKELKEREYAKKFYRDNYGHVNYRSQTAMDAARRHYRRTHKNESSIFESVEIL